MGLRVYKSKRALIIGIAIYLVPVLNVLLVGTKTITALKNLPSYTLHDIEF